MSPETRALVGQARAALGPALPKPAWTDTCPCGHVRDEDCIRHRKPGPAMEFGTYDATTLGLDHIAHTARCRAAA